MDIILRYFTIFIVLISIRDLNLSIERYKNEAEQQVNRNRKLADEIESKNRFIATLAHEIRNFLTVYVVYDKIY